jgi:alpha,alpha-trehalase
MGCVCRCRTDETDGGPVRQGEGVPDLLFWAGIGLSIAGEAQRAHYLMERLVRVASPLGFAAEAFDAGSDRHLGNSPRLFPLPALIEAPARIILAQQFALEGLGRPRAAAAHSMTQAR